MKYSILIIEDDPSYASMMEVILLMEGFDVRTASDGQSGIAMLRDKRPDLTLCDIMMPEMDGHSVLEILKGDKTLADIPFVFVTALGGAPMSAVACLREPTTICPNHFPPMNCLQPLPAGFSAMR